MSFFNMKLHGFISYIFYIIRNLNNIENQHIYVVKDAWECERTKRIEKIQDNENSIVKAARKEAGLW